MTKDETMDNLTIEQLTFLENLGRYGATKHKKFYETLVEHYEKIKPPAPKYLTNGQYERIYLQSSK